MATISTINSTDKISDSRTTINGNFSALNTAKVETSTTINSNALSGNITLDQDDVGDGTTYKQYSSTEKTKLSGIETAADVTDATNVGSSIHGAAAKATIADTDKFAMIDTEASNVLKTSVWTLIKSTLKTYFDTLYAAALGADDNYVTDAEKTVIGNTSGTNSGDETTTTLGSKINGATEKTTPVDADMVGLMDSAASNILKKLSWANIKATLKTYFDTLYPSGNVGAWTEWTPTFANFTKGSATIYAYYSQVGKIVTFSIKVTLAADSSMGTAPTFTLPVTAKDNGGSIIGVTHIRDAAPAHFDGSLRQSSTTTAIPLVWGTGGGYSVPSGITAAVPMTWTTGDSFDCCGTYEAA